MNNDFEKLLEQESDRIKLLESMVNAIYKEKIIVDDAGNKTVKLSPAELHECISCEKEIMLLKRKNNNLPKEMW